ncbi:hypothetical protein B0H67DRAFT_536144 [Lasiosphaeris hirsuta]|uniref:Heterokaryon incompatibility domain-containing protein n=1 Tax=Lasiosphaeris hirsuta TaxID=260670 RepID=A0AA40ASJ1_9PEZI|nr:hypothetical protein B0H67DRAFT_536144 [Lasiosphaeris hirsuta]
MTSTAEAEKIVEDIRRDMTLDGTISKKKPILLALEKALEVLSDQLYDKSTHFILELIQNADDNTYDLRPDSPPTLNFTYKKGTVRIDSNETGFLEKHVRAICTIGQSTKGGIGHSTRYIGEKGIGFKSVFKVADVVSIASRHFTFHFDKSKPLGLIAPIWSDKFPEKRPEGLTSIHLKLAPNCDESCIVQEFKKLDAQILVFLRQLREINITVTENDGRQWSRKLQRSDGIEDGMRITTLHGDDNTWRYLVTRHRVDGLPREPKRPECSESEILLAFPLADFRRGPVTETQSVYAFLPIRGYGFPFLLQGDFLLTANRQDIDADSAWNRALRDASVDAFVGAMERLVSGQLKYWWPQYLPVQTMEDFFEPMRKQILSRLSEKPLLESCDSESTSLRIPPSLFCISQDDRAAYLDEDGKPFSLCARNKTRYLSPKYPVWATSALYALQVKVLTAKDFLGDLQLVISTDPVAFQGRGKPWHSQLAKCLAKLATERNHEKLISSMDIIPLRRSGLRRDTAVEWVAAKGRKVFFPQNEGKGSLPIPKSIDVNIVDHEVAADYNRRNLFKLLGVKPCDVAVISQVIVDMHSGNDSISMKLSDDELVQHAKYLYLSPWRGPEDRYTPFWFATDRANMPICRGSDTYIRSAVNEGCAEARILSCFELTHPFLHGSYLDAFSKDQHSWVSFLCRSFGLQMLPRLVTFSPDAAWDNFTMSEDFRFVMHKCTPADVLELLRDNWRHYAAWIEDDSPKDTPKQQESKLGVRSALGSMTVETQAGRFPLMGTLLPCVDGVVDDIPGVRILKIKEPGDKRWKMLEHLGVSIRRDVKYLLACLEQMTVSTAVKKEQASHVYSQLQVEYANNHEVTIWNAFSKLPLIYTALGSTSSNPMPRWTSTKECISKRLNIAGEYDQSSKLFKSLLATGSGQAGDAIQSLLLIDDTTSLSRITELFVKAGSSLGAMNSKKAASAAKALQNKPIFPIREMREEGGNGPGFQSLKALGDASDWYIADRDHLAASFVGVVPLLAFSVDNLKDMKPLLDALQLERRKLSKMVKSDTVPSGKVSLHVERTEHLRARSQFFIALVPRSHKGRAAISRQMEQVMVNTADRITERYTFIAGNGKTHTGREGEGEAVISWTTDSMRLFMALADVSSWDVPSEVVGAIEERCGIVDNEHKKLLAMLLGPASLEKLHIRFRKRDIQVAEPKEPAKLRVPKEGYAAMSGDIPNGLMLRGLVGDDAESFLDGLLPSSFRRIFSSALAHESTTTSAVDSRASLPFMDFGTTTCAKLGPGADEPGKVGETCAIVARTTSVDIQYLGELTTSYLFVNALGSLYRPEAHWTSMLRYRAGISPFPDDIRTSASFTIADRETSVKMAGFLCDHGCTAAAPWKKQARPTTFHFDVAVTPGDEQSTFSWTSSHIERMRTLRLPSEELESPKDVLIWVRICNVYVEPRFHFFVDPWRLYGSNRLVLPDHWGLTARIVNESAPLAPPAPPPSVNGIGERPAAASTGFAGSGLRVNVPSFGPPPPLPGYIHHPHNRQQQQQQQQPPRFHAPPQYPGGSQWHPQHPYRVAFQEPFNSQIPPGYMQQVPNPYQHFVPPYPNGTQPFHAPSTTWNNTRTERGAQGLYSQVPQVPVYGAPLWPQVPPTSTQALTTASRGDQPYQYRPLSQGEIRLVSLLPGPRDAPLRAIVYHAVLENSGQYRAVSYMWGSSEKPHTMWTPDGKLPLTWSLDAALRRIRHPAQPSVLWVDAICINQDEQDDAAKAEKTAQIRMLPHIFQRSTCVFAYIGNQDTKDGDGKGNDSDDAALETLMQIQAQQVCKGKAKPWPEQLAEIPSSWSGKPMPADHDAAWSAIGRFFSNPWFRRAWIVQEIVFAPSVRVISGSWMVDWGDLFSAVEIIQNASDAPSDLHSEARQAWAHFTTLAAQRELEARRKRPELLDVLENFRHVKSKYARDHFFALLGLCKKAEDTALDPDYDTDFAVIVRRYACVIANKHKNSGGGGSGNIMQMLYRAGLSSQPARFPSWIPDWTAPSQNSCGSLYSLSHRGARWAASTEPKLKFRCDAASDELEIEGRLVSRIVAISRACCVRNQMAPYLAEVESLARRSSSSADPKAAWKIPVAGGATLPRSTSATAPGVDMRASYEALRAYLAAGGAVDTPPQPPSQYSGATTTTAAAAANLEERERERILWQQWVRAQTYLSALRETFVGWRCVVANSGHCGIAPGGVHVDDVVVVLSGGAVPFVMRKGDRGEGSFRLVGECYMHGLMDGEAARIAPLDGVSSTMLRLY